MTPGRRRTGRGRAKPGDPLEIGGPRGSTLVADDFDVYLLVGDETALPSIGRRVESLRAGVPVTTIVLVDGPGDIQAFKTSADWRPIWLFRSGSGRDDADLLGEALAQWPTPSGDGYVWIGAKARAARRLKTFLLEDRGHPEPGSRRPATGSAEKRARARNSIIEPRLLWRGRGFDRRIAMRRHEMSP